MKTSDNVGAAATSTLGYLRTGGPACSRFTAPPVLTVQGTGLPIDESMGGRSPIGTLDRTRLFRAVAGARLGAFGSGVMGADRVEQNPVVIPAVADDPWDPPRRTPSRC